MVNSKLESKLVHKGEHLVVVMVTLGSTKILVANSYIKPKGANMEAVNKKEECKKSWNTIKKLCEELKPS